MTTQLSDDGILFADGNTQKYPSVPVRQTVLSGPVDTSGLPAFGGSTGSTVVTASAGTLAVTAANGLTNRIGSKASPSWSGLSTNGAMFKYVDVNADGTLTEGVGTLAPIYQPGGTPSVTAGQFTFNWQEMRGYVGNGSTAVASYRVYVGEVTVAGGVVTAIIWYALMGRYNSGRFSIAINTTYAKSHNVGAEPLLVNTFGAISGGALVPATFMYSGAYEGIGVYGITNKSVSVRTQATVALPGATTGPTTTPNEALIIVDRGW